MTAQILVSELGNLIQESKRKHTDLRNAAEKSLDEIKALRLVSENQISTDLSQRPNFVTPFIIACGTKNVKFTNIAITCLQRLAVSRALPRPRLREILEAIREASPAGLEVQLKILQALPSLVQNYADDLKGDLIATALNICSILQASKNGIVTNTAAATLQQLVITIFDKVVTEDEIGHHAPTVGEAPTEDGPIQLRAAALDAYEVFNDLCLLTESQKPLFLKSSVIPKTFGLELIESVLTNHAQIFLDHPEQATILRLRVMPFIMNALSEKLSFAITVRIIRILYTLLRFHLSILSSEGEIALSLLTYMLDHDTASWKRSLCMEVLRGLFADSALVRRIFSMYDAQQGRKTILRDLVAAFVRVSTEKPSVIGLGPQSSMPWTNHGNNAETDQAMLEASGVPGFIGTSASSVDPGVGISTQWSTMRVPCIDQLDKVEPPLIPGSYIYSLTLSCINGFSEGLAKFVLPLTVPERSNTKLRPSMSKIDEHESKNNTNEPKHQEKTHLSNKKSVTSINPLTLESHPLYEDVKTCAGIIDQCWPAILATCSTFLHAALDAEYYRSLVRSFQKFTHVAGLLHLSTPRDAFLTTLGKVAVPSNLLASNVPTTPPAPAPTSTTEKQSIFNNAKGLLSGESLVSDKTRRLSTESSVALNTRNLLCLRALLNLGIALGPTLGSAWAIILGTLQHAEIVIFSNTKTRNFNTNQKNEILNVIEGSALSANFGIEIKAVETAASRLVESTTEFSNESFLGVVTALCSLLGRDNSPSTGERRKSQWAPQLKTLSHPNSRANSIIISPVIQSQEDLFVLAKLCDIASMNIDRLITHPPHLSGWEIITSEIISVSCSPIASSSVRRRAAEILVRLILDATTAATLLVDSERSKIQLRLLETLKRALQSLESDERELSVAVHFTDIEVHKTLLEGLKSILEKCGETFVSGWDVAFDIIGSVFIKNNGLNIDESLKESNSTATRSAKLIRSAFNSIQLICSDFLSSLPSYCFIILVDTLYKFCSQDDDLNISLTTVTFFWDLSDFISGRTDFFSLSSDLTQDTNHNNLVDILGRNEVAISDTSLWMLLLLRLAAVTTDERLELRNSSIQTLLRIFDAYGDQLSPEAWSICLESVIFKLLRSIIERLKSTCEADNITYSDKDKNGWYETTVLVLNGITNLLADYLDVLSKYHFFNRSWQVMMNYLDTLLSFQILDIDTAVFKALRKILEKGNVEDVPNKNFDADAIELAWKLWSKSVPKSTFDKNEESLNNQKCLLAYVSALQEIYRLIQWKMDASHVTIMLTLLRKAVVHASAETYSADIDHLTSLQKQVLELLKMIRTDVKGVPAALISQVAEFVELAFRCKNVITLEAQSPTFVALSRASMTNLKDLIVAHSLDLEIYSSGAIFKSLDALATPIILKYSFIIVSKNIAPWKQATTCALSILESIIPQITKVDLDQDVVQPIWASIVKISQGITKADCTEITKINEIELDEKFDIESFLRFRELVTSALGSISISDSTLRTYTGSLFQMSLVHIHSLRDFSSFNCELLFDNPQSLKGQTIDPAPSARSRMSYVCFDELVTLVRIEDGSDARIKLSQAAAPFLLLRAGLTLQTYIADQPLRGLMPQPLTQRKELLYILRSLIELESEPKAIPKSSLMSSQCSKYGAKMHLCRLYPFIVKAIQAASRDQEVLECLGSALDGILIDSSCT